MKALGVLAKTLDIVFFKEETTLPGKDQEPQELSPCQTGQPNVMASFRTGRADSSHGLRRCRWIPAAVPRRSP